VKVVVDTNVFISGVFFGGAPGRILEAWRDRAIEFVLSAEILEEYLLACALAADVPVVVSGDRDLLDHTGWCGIRVLRPRQFTDEFLS